MPSVTAKVSKSICFKKFQLIQDYQKEAVLPGVAPREGWAPVNVNIPFLKLGKK